MISEIIKKINLSKVIKMDYILWHRLISEDTYNSLEELGYDIQYNYETRDYYISWTR